MPEKKNTVWSPKKAGSVHHIGAAVQDGFEKLQMSFMSDIYVLCEDCKGKRYNDSTLEVCYKGKNIAEVLEMTVDEAREYEKKSGRGAGWPNGCCRPPARYAA